LPTWDTQLALPPSFDEVMESRNQEKAQKKDSADQSEQGGDQ
jgi:hypothetical protein